MKSIEIITLHYSELTCEFFPNPMDSKRNLPVGAKVIARQIDSRDAEQFINRMHANRRTKQEQRELAHYALQEGGRPKVNYVKGRKRGRYPTLEIVRLELELFMALKSYHRKLV